MNTTESRNTSGQQLFMEAGRVLDKKDYRENCYTVIKTGAGDFYLAVKSNKKRGVEQFFRIGNQHIRPAIVALKTLKSNDRYMVMRAFHSIAMGARA